MTNLHEPVKHCIDFACLGVTVGAVASWLPPLSALASLVWVGLRIYETTLDIKRKQKEDKP